MSQVEFILMKTMMMLNVLVQPYLGLELTMMMQLLMALVTKDIMKAKLILIEVTLQLLSD